MVESFQDEVIRTLPHLRAFARSLTGDRDRAEDLVQDAVCRALAAQRQFEPGTNFKAWIFTIVRNLHVNNLRRSKFRAEPLDDVAPEVSMVGPRQEASLEFNELKRAMQHLSVEQREVLILVGASGFSYEDAAKICNCAVGTIKSRLSRARRDLMDLMLGEGTLPKRVRGEAAVPAVFRRREVDQEYRALSTM